MSPGSRGSAAGRHGRRVIIHNALKHSDKPSWLRKDLTGFFEINECIVYLVNGSRQKDTDLLHPVGGGKGPAAQVSKSKVQ